jgi:sec-independent protein translocase protein TatA
VPNLGITELIVIFMILLLVFGGSRLPQIGESLGRTARGFKRALASNDAIKVEPSDAPVQPKQVSAPTPAPAKRAGADREVSEAELVDKKG